MAYTQPGIAESIRQAKGTSNVGRETKKPKYAGIITSGGGGALRIIETSKPETVSGVPVTSKEKELIEQGILKKITRPQTGKSYTFGLTESGKGVLTKEDGVKLTTGTGGSAGDFVRKIREQERTRTELDQPKITYGEIEQQARETDKGYSKIIEQEKLARSNLINDQLGRPLTQQEENLITTGQLKKIERTTGEVLVNKGSNISITKPLFDIVPWVPLKQSSKKIQQPYLIDIPSKKMSVPYSGIDPLKPGSTKEAIISGMSLEQYRAEQFQPVYVGTKGGFVDALSSDAGFWSKYKAGFKDLIGARRGGENPLSRYGTTAYNINKEIGFRVGRVIEGAKQKPIQTAATLAAFYVGGSVGSRLLSLKLGISAKKSQSIVSTTMLGGFAGYSEIKEPGSVLSVPGAFGTVSEFGTYALGSKIIGAGYKSTKMLSKRYVPYSRTTQDVKLQPTSKNLQISEIPLFEGGTRVGTSYEQAIKSISVSDTLYHTTATPPAKLFGDPNIIRNIKAGVGKSSFVVEAPPKIEVGGERARFNEDFFYFGKGEAYPVFGETGVLRLGSIGFERGGAVSKPARVLEYGKKLFTEYPKRYQETILGSQLPTILRLDAKISPYNYELTKQIGSGKTGSKLRAELGEQIRTSPGKIFPGSRTSGLGSGELEYAAGVGTEFFLLSGTVKTTYLPKIGRFARVLDIGLKPGKAKTNTYNFKGRLRNIKETALTDILGIEQFGATPKKSNRTTKEIFKIKTRTRERPTERTRAVIRKDINRILERTQDRTMGRQRTKTRVRTRTKRDEIDRLLDRTRERPTERTRTRERRRNNIDRVLGRTRERTRERTRTRPRIRDPIKEIDEIIKIEFKKQNKATKKKTYKKKGVLSKYTPSLVAKAYNIKGKKKKRLTGLEIRPITNNKINKVI